MSNIHIGNHNLFNQSKHSVAGLNELLKTRYQPNQTMASAERKQTLEEQEAQIYAENKERANMALDAVLGESLESPKFGQFGLAIASIGSESGNELTRYHQNSDYLNRQISSLDADKFKQTAIGEVQIRMAELNQFMVDSGLLETIRGGGGLKTKFAIFLRKLPFVPESLGDPIVKKLTEDLKASETLTNMANSLKTAGSRLHKDSEHMIKEEELSYQMELKLYQDFKFLTAIHEVAIERLNRGREEMVKSGTWTDEHDKIYHSKILIPIVEQITAIYERLLVSHNLRHVRRTNREVNDNLIREVKQVSELTLPAMTTALNNLVVAFQHKNIQSLTQGIRENHHAVMNAAIESSLKNLQTVQDMREFRRINRQEMLEHAKVLQNAMDQYRETERHEYRKYVEEIESFTKGNYNNSDQREMDLIKEIQAVSNKPALEDNSQQGMQFGTQIPKEAMPVYASDNGMSNPISAILKG